MWITREKKLEKDYFLTIKAIFLRKIKEKYPEHKQGKSTIFRITTKMAYTHATGVTRSF